MGPSFWADQGTQHTQSSLWPWSPTECLQYPLWESDPARLLECPVVNAIVNVSSNTIVLFRGSYQKIAMRKLYGIGLQGPEWTRLHMCVHTHMHTHVNTGSGQKLKEWAVYLCLVSQTFLREKFGLTRGLWLPCQINLGDYKDIKAEQHQQETLFFFLKASCQI